MTKLRTYHVRDVRGTTMLNPTPRRETSTTRRNQFGRKLDQSGTIDVLNDSTWNERLKDDTQIATRKSRPTTTRQLANLRSKTVHCKPLQRTKLLRFEVSNVDSKVTRETLERSKNPYSHSLRSRYHMINDRLLND